MSSQDYPLIPESHAPTRLPQTTDSTDAANYYAHSAFTTNEDSDADKSGSGSGSGSGKRNPYYYKKQKTGETASDYRVDFRKDREEWSDTAIACLLEAYTEKLNQLNRGNLRGRDWEEVAEVVSERCGGGNNNNNENDNNINNNNNSSGEKREVVKAGKSVEQCKNKIDNLKKRYKVEVQRMGSSGSGPSNWLWFKQIEAIMGTINNNHNNAISSSNYGLVNKITYNLKSKPQQNLKWRRVVFKISGSALVGNCHNIDPKVVMQIAREVASACRLGVEVLPKLSFTCFNCSKCSIICVAIVLGGRNFFCGDSWLSDTGFDRPTAYQIGMMATVMNSILLQSALEKLEIKTRVQSAFALPEVDEPYSRQRAIRHLEKGRVVIFGGIGAGTGNPLFTTDAAAALRASELNADAMVKGVSVNGIYDSHSGNGHVVPEHISYREAVSGNFTSMDTMAITYCEENGIPVVVFNLLEPGNISSALCGGQVGTLIDQSGGIS
ncbi:Uridine monophosphate kinase [Citrus sinensis]|uniref:Uridine monophosphate kinase n=1 Tax=Citrus sinensis TaxID=2711 RepID=A0ACB8L6C8_CITSI|nr:Uridine monophosphate kinase [Citrus sinensis]